MEHVYIPSILLELNKFSTLRSLLFLLVKASEE